MNMKSKTAMVLSAMAFGAFAADVRVGFRETDGVDVESGTTVQSGEIALGTEAKFYKTGAGTLEVSLDKVDNRTDAKLTVLDGTLRLTDGAFAPSATPTVPAVLREKAALWLTPDSVVVTNGDDNAAYASKWRDLRDVEDGTAKYLQALPRWQNPRSGVCVKNGIPPVKVTKDGVPALYFGGGKSGQCMRLYNEAGTDSVGFDENIHHLYVVHGVYEWWGNVVGTHGSTRNYGFVTSLGSYVSTYPLESTKLYHFYPRGEFTRGYVTATTWLNGERINPFAVPPKQGFQLLEFDHHACPVSFHDIFYNQIETMANEQGGDYVSEIIVFTQRLHECDRMAVERYLMDKYGFSGDSGYPMQANGQRRTVSVAVASDAVVEVAGASESTPIALSGEGTVRKSGTGALVLGPTADTAEFRGTLDLQGGSVLAKGGALPPIAVKGGDRVNARMVSSEYANTRTAAVDSGLALDVGTDAGAGTVVKDGSSQARVNAIASDVKNLVVSDGRLTLESKTSSGSLVTGGAIEAEIPNADFEDAITDREPGTYGTYSLPRDATGLNGWRNVSGSGAYIEMVNNWTVFIRGNNIFPSGKRCLQIQGAGENATTVTFPKAGVYELSFYARSRSGGYSKTATETAANNSFSRPQVELRLGKDDAHLACFGHWHGTPEAFIRYRYRMPPVEAGSYSFSFRSIDGANDGTSYFDDVRMTFVAETAPDNRVDLPNGDFELLERPTAAPYSFSYFTTRQGLVGWTYEIDAGYESYITNPPVAVANSGISILSRSYFPIPFFDVGRFEYGASALAFMCNNGAAKSDPFTPPAGTYRLSGRISCWSGNYDYGGGGEKGGWNATPAISVVVTRANDTNVDLGTQSGKHWHETVDVIWPTEITVDGTEPVRLTLRQTIDGGTCLVDDLKLIPVDRPMATGNLVRDGDFEDSSSVWKTFRGVDPAVKKYSTAEIYSYGSGEGNWGYARYSGSKCLKLQTMGGMYQDILFPTKGLYRLRFHTRIRPDYPRYGFNSIRAWVHPTDDNAHTNVIGWTRVVSTNFVEQAFTFEIPESKTYRFALQGMGNPDRDVFEEDCCSFVDGVSVEQVTETLADVPSMPENLTVKVANGASLGLEFSGTQTISRLKLGGIPVRGLVNAQTHPGFISGRGALNVEGTGLVLIVR